MKSTASISLSSFLLLCFSAPYSSFYFTVMVRVTVCIINTRGIKQSGTVAATATTTTNAFEQHHSYGARNQIDDTDNTAYGYRRVDATAARITGCSSNNNSNNLAKALIGLPDAATTTNSRSARVTIRK